MRNNRHKIKLFNFDASRHRFIYKAEAEYLLEFKHAQEFCRFCGRSRSRSKCPGRKEHDIVLKLISPEKRDGNSPASISYSEMLANAGIAENDGAVRRAREKVSEWAKTGIPRMKAACNG